MLDESVEKVLSWVENEKTAKVLRWLYTSKEGEAYQKRETLALHEER